MTGPLAPQQRGARPPDARAGEPPVVRTGPGQLDAEAALLHPEPHLERPVMASRVEMIAFEQVENRDPPLLLDVGIAAQDRMLVQLDVDDPRLAHAFR